MRAKSAPNQIPVFDWLNRQTGLRCRRAARGRTGVSWPEIQRLLELAVRGQFVRRLAFRPLKKAAYALNGRRS